MKTKSESTTGMTVGEIMNANVVTIPAHFTMSEAAKILIKNDIGGAPVVDEMGKCVGIISGADYVRLEQNRESICSVGDYGSVHEVITDSPGGPIQLDSQPFGAITRYMSQGVQSVSRETSIQDAVRILFAERIHRLVILDETGRPEGVVTTHDLLEAVIDA